jgi:hypothetical protein
VVGRHIKLQVLLLRASEAMIDECWKIWSPKIWVFEEKEKCPIQDVCLCECESVHGLVDFLKSELYGMTISEEAMHIGQEYITCSDLVNDELHIMGIIPIFSNSFMKSACLIKA